MTINDKEIFASKCIAISKAVDVPFDEINFDEQPHAKLMAFVNILFVNAQDIVAGVNQHWWSKEKNATYNKWVAEGRQAQKLVEAAAKKHNDFFIQSLRNYSKSTEESRASNKDRIIKECKDILSAKRSSRAYHVAGLLDRDKLISAYLAAAHWHKDASNSGHGSNDGTRIRDLLAQII
jgi:hypothetical protein